MVLVSPSPGPSSRHPRHQWWIRCDACRRILGEQLSGGDVLWHVAGVVGHGDDVRRHSVPCPDCNHVRHYELNLHRRRR